MDGWCDGTLEEFQDEKWWMFGRNRKEVLRKTGADCAL
jgi:glucan phosphorylase